MKPQTTICAILFSVCLLSVMVPSTNSQASLIANAGFETVEPIGTFWPNQYGDWNGDRGTVVAAENGIAPFEGLRMLRFGFSAPQPFGATNLGASQVEQLIDASLFGDVASGNVTITATAWFNRVGGDSQTDTLFHVQLDARAGSPASYPSDKETASGFLGFSRTDIFSDSDPATWEQGTVSLTLPSNTSFVSIQLIAVENVFNDQSGVEFDGHYADGVSLSVSNPVPEPGSLLIWVVGLVASLLVHRNRRFRTA